MVVEALAGPLAPGSAAGQEGPLAAACRLEGGAWTPDAWWLVFNSTLLPSPWAAERLANGSLSQQEARGRGGVAPGVGRAGSDRTQL